MLACKNNRMTKSGIYTPVYLMLIVLLLPAICPAAGDLVVPGGTKISLQLNEKLSTKSNKEQDPFTAMVVEPIYQGDRLVIPKGSIVSGSISRIIRPGITKGTAKMNLLFQSISIPGHGEHPISAVLDSPHPEGTIKGPGSAKRDLTRVLVPSIAAAGIGGAVGGAKGAGIAGGIAAVVTIGSVLLTPGGNLELSRGTALIILLDKPLIIPSDAEGTTARNN
jgi:hypothetical protein